MMLLVSIFVIGLYSSPNIEVWEIPHPQGYMSPYDHEEFGHCVDDMLTRIEINQSFK